MHALPLLVASRRRCAASRRRRRRRRRARRGAAAARRRPRRAARESRTSSPFAQVEDVHVGAARAQPLDGRRADPARAAGDERDAALRSRSGWSWCISIRSRTWHSTRCATTRSARGDRISSGRPAGSRSTQLDAARRAASTRRSCARRRRRCGCRPRSRAAAGRASSPANLAPRGRAGAAPGRDDPRDLHRAPAAAARPPRELEAWATRLDELDAPLTAAFVREAREVYARARAPCRLSALCALRGARRARAAARGADRAARRARPRRDRRPERPRAVARGRGRPRRRAGRRGRETTGT